MMVCAPSRILRKAELEANPSISIPLQLRAACARQLHREPHLRARHAPDRWYSVPPRRGWTRSYLGRGEVLLYGGLLELGVWTWRTGTLSRGDCVHWSAWAVGVDDLQWAGHDFGVVEEIYQGRMVV